MPSKEFDFRNILLFYVLFLVNAPSSLVAIFYFRSPNAIPIYWPNEEQEASRQEIITTSNPEHLDQATALRKRCMEMQFTT